MSTGEPTRQSPEPLTDDSLSFGQHMGLLSQRVQLMLRGVACKCQAWLPKSVHELLTLNSCKFRHISIMTGTGTGIRTTRIRMVVAET